jgi:type IV pilus assembly protein PilV
MNGDLINESPAIAHQQGIVLVEALVAILLFSLGVLALAGLQASLVRNTTDSKYRAEAVYVAQKRLGEMWADPTGVAAGNYTTTSTIPGLPQGSITVVSNKVGEYEITVSWIPPGEPIAHNVVVVGNVVENPI